MGQGKRHLSNFSENKVFEIFRDMASDYGNRNHPFSHRNISGRNRKEDASELLRTEQRFIAGGTGCVFPARPKDPKTATT